MYLPDQKGQDTLRFRQQSIYIYIRKHFEEKLNTYVHGCLFKIGLLLPMNLFYKPLLIICLWALINSNAIADKTDFDKGLRAYRIGDYKTALQKWLPRAEKGDPSAQHMIGFLYATGRGVELKPKVTIFWWELAAQQQFPPAQHSLGTLYRKGLGVKQNSEVAAMWIGRAATSGYPDAQYDFGIMYATGEGVSQDFKKASEWLDKAALNKGLKPRSLRKNIYKFLPHFYP